jgi:hypothetical protein
MRDFAPISRIAQHARHSTRALWFVLLAMHVPALIAVGGSVVRGEDAFSIVSIVGLVLTVAFFVLKCMDVAFLRLRGPGAKIAFLLVCAVVHREAITSPVARQIIDGSPMVLVAGAAAVGSSRRIRLRVRRRVRGWVRGVVIAMQRLIGQTEMVLRSVVGFVRQTRWRTGMALYRVGEPTRGPPVVAF